MSNIIAAVNIRRREAALALFQGIHLQGLIVRHIPTDYHRADNAIVSLAHEACSRYSISSVAIEQGKRSSARITHGYKSMCEAFQEESASVEEVPYAVLLESYAYRPLRLRHHLRKIAKKLWPVLDSKRYGNAALDAVIVGLHIQTKRLLNIHENEQ
jgi:hypothetical protein